MVQRKLSTTWGKPQPIGISQFPKKHQWSAYENTFLGLLTVGRITIQWLLGSETYC